MNITTVTIQGCHSQMRYTPTLFQYDYGQILKIEGVELPDTFQAHFCNVSDSSTKTVLGSDNQVSIPDEYLDTGEDILCFIYLHTGEEDGETEYKILIPVTARQSITDEEPTPEEQSVIDQLVSALNSGVARAENAATNAETSEGNAKTSEDNAKESELAAKASEESALQAKDDAEAAKTEAEEAEANATQKATDAEGSANRASASATLSQSWAVGGTNTRQGEDTNNAKYYAESTISAKDAAVLAKTQAESARDTAVQAKTYAETAAQTATQKASEATQSAADASQSASSASASSTSASQSAALATSAKEAAETAQGLAEDARDEAVTAKDDAQTAQQEAESAAQSIAQSAQQIETNTQDISDLKSALNDMYPTDTASGAIANFPDGAKDVPVDSLKVDIEPIQDLHGYDNPWPAGGGKNLLNWSVEALGTSRVNIINENDDSTLFPLKAGTYTFSDNGNNCYAYWRKEGTTDNNIIHTTGSKQGTFTLDVDANVIFWFYAVGIDINSFTQIQLESGSTATAFAPYSNICPISGHEEVSVVRCGKNLTSVTEHPDIKSFWGTNWPDQLTELNKLPVGTYTITVNFETKTITSGSNPRVGAPFIRALVNDSYVNLTPYSVTEDQSPSVGKIYTKTVTFTITEQTKGKIVNCYLYCGGGGAGIGTYRLYNVQIENSSSVSDFEPYQGETYQIPLGDTIYGGTLDVTTGELVVDRAMTNLEEGMNPASIGGIPLWTKRLSEAKTVPNGSVANIISEAYKAIRFNAISISVNYIALRDSGLLYVNTGSADITPQGIVVYELASPISISLTPQQVTTLYGTNNVFADTGDTEVTYKADIQLYIQKKISAAVAALS